MYREKLQPWLYFLKKIKKEKQREGKKQEKF